MIYAACFVPGCRINIKYAKSVISARFSSGIVLVNKDYKKLV